MTLENQPAASSTPKEHQTRFREIDGLRGIAVIVVILVHYYAGIVYGLAPNFHQLYKSLAGVSVDLFFVISGFLIGGILLDHQRCKTTIKAFYLRRALRILPIYWLVLYVAFEPFSGVNTNASHKVSFLSYLFFQQNLSMSFGLWALPMLGPLWSLAIEEHFYLLAPLMVRWLSARKLLVAILAIILLTPAARALVFYWNPPHAGEILGKFPLLRLDSIAFGVLGALLWRNTTARQLLDDYKKLLPGLVLLLGGITLAFLPWPGFRLRDTLWLRDATQAAFFLSVIVFCLTKNESWVARLCRFSLLRWSGVRCYFLYVFHLPILIVASELAPNYYVASLVSLLLCLIFAEVSWRFLEKPLIGYSKRWRYAPLKTSLVEEFPTPDPKR